MSGEGARWPVLQQMRVRFVPEEDRIFLHGETLDGEEHAVWLTQRLARRMVPALLDWLSRHQGSMSLEEPVSVRAPAAPGEAASASSPPVPVHQPQDADPAAAPPAPALRALEPWVAHSAQLAGQGARLVLTLTQGGQAGVCMPLTAAAMRQCLRALRRACLEAEWPADMWPAALSASAPSATGAAVTLH